MGERSSRVGAKPVASPLLVVRASRRLARFVWLSSGTLGLARALTLGACGTMTVQSQFRRFSWKALGLGGACWVMSWSASASAQQIENEISVQRFDPAPGPGNFITTRSARSEGQLVWTAGFMANYAYRPLSIKICRTSPCGEAGTPGVRLIPVVENLVSGDAYGSFTIFPELQLGLRVPVSWVKGQGIDSTGNPREGGLSAVGMGDLQLEAKGRFYGSPESPYALGAYAYATVPFGDWTARGSYIGSSTGSVGGALVGDVRLGDWTAGVNLGAIYRGEARIGTGTVLGPEARWGAAVGYQVGPIVRVVADVWGSTNFTSSLGANAAELDLAAQVTPLGLPLTFTAGAGVGIFKGIGVPDARAFLGVVYNADIRDRDGDGIIDALDACPDEPEDKDGFEDSDGCPEPDNDGDGIPDVKDQCPNEPEDFDGFQDEDGCPDPDNDGDGILDEHDLCPDEPENFNGFQDGDGCPDEKDSDGDGILDSLDQCPNEPEDYDGFEDEDGCPDPDNDGDGIPDTEDECIDLPEDGKGTGREKTDGCPYDA